MNVISKHALKDFWTTHPQVKSRVEAWYQDVENVKWKQPADVTDRYPNASAIADSRVVFRFGSNYRLIVHIDYTFECVYIKWWGTHDEYDEIDATTVENY